MSQHFIWLQDLRFLVIFLTLSICMTLNVKCEVVISEIVATELNGIERKNALFHLWWRDILDESTK